MKSHLTKLKSIITGLKKLTDIESNVIAKRAYDQIAALTAQKESLLAELDEVASALSASDLSDSLLAELNAIREKSEENAIALKATATGVREARQRLQKLKEAEFNTGVYQRDGGALRNPHASTVMAKA